MKPVIHLKQATPLFLVVLALTCLWVGSAPKAIGVLPGQSVKVIYSFAGEGDGEYADTDLETDSAGNIYGTTVLGGDFGSGTVFKLAPTPNGWVHTVLYSFTGGADGGEPYKGVTLDAQGNIYGTAVTGGSGSCEGGCGVVYKLTNSGGTWTQTVIHAFAGGDDGSGPGARVAVDPQGNVYGMTPTGGAFGLGTIYCGGVNGLGAVYQLAPRPTGEWRESVLYSFAEGGDGNSPISKLTFDSVGNLYGTTSEGGLGRGTIFKLTRGQNGSWVESL